MTFQDYLQFGLFLGILLLITKPLGIYLDKVPFNIPSERLQVVFECRGHSMGGGIERGVIRTYRYTPIQHTDVTQ